MEEASIFQNSRTFSLSFPLIAARATRWSFGSNLVEDPEEDNPQEVVLNFGDVVQGSLEDSLPLAIELHEAIDVFIDNPASVNF